MGAIATYPEPRSYYPENGTLSAAHPPFRIYVHYPTRTDEILTVFLFDNNAQDDPHAWRERFMRPTNLVAVTNELSEAYDLLHTHAEFLRQ